MKSCPDCLGEIPQGAEVCRHCGERVTGERCTECGARNWSEARLCRWCGSRLQPRQPKLDFSPLKVTAQRLPTFFQRGRFLPQSIVVTPEKIVVRTPGPFHLSQQESEIPWAKVAGFDYHSGILWDRVTIETRGQAATTVGCLAKSDGTRVRELLRKMET